MSDQVFLVRYETPRDVEVYDCNGRTIEYHIEVSALQQPSDLTSCAEFRCLYISDWSTPYRVHRVEPNSGETSELPVWDKPEGISVTPHPTCHVIVACGEVRKIKEFTTLGHLVREIQLQDDIGGHLFHAVETDGRFAVGCGYRSDPLHRVCIVDSGGRVVRSYGGSPGSAAGRLKNPRRLAVDGDGNVFVVDDTRVSLLSPTLADVRELASARDVNRGFVPVRLCLDAARGRILVPDGRNTDVLVFQVRRNPAVELEGSVGIGKVEGKGKKGGI